MRSSGSWTRPRGTTAVGQMLACALVASVTACGAARPNASAITRLEQQRTAKPTSESIRRSLGIKYFEDKRYAEARTELIEATKLDPKDGLAALYLGQTAEAQNDLPAARAAYSTYVKFGHTSGVRKQLDEKLAALQRKEIGLQAKDAVANEARIGVTPGPRNTIAVLPFVFSGADTTYKPLERGFAELITTDLARFPGLTVLERSRLEAILDELKLQASGATDAGTSVRAGKLLQAGSLVSGQLDMQPGNNLRAVSVVVNVQTSQTAAAGQQTSPVEQLFTIENTIVFAIAQQFNITITTAIRNAIEQRPTKSVQAFLSYSRGLTAEDQGRYDDAGRFFQDATRLDPGFGGAQQKSTEVHNVVAGAQVTSATVESGLKGSAEGAVVAAATQGVVATGTSTNTALIAAANLNPSVAGATTGGAAITSGGIVPAGPQAGTGIGADNPSVQSAVVTLTIGPPKPGGNR